MNLDATKNEVRIHKILYKSTDNLNFIDKTAMEPLISNLEYTIFLRISILKVKIYNFQAPPLVKHRYRDTRSIIGAAAFHF